MFKKKKNKKAADNNEEKKEGKKAKKKLDMVDRIIFAGFTLIILVFVIIALFAMDAFRMKSNLVNKITEDLMSQQEDSIDQYISKDKIDGYREIISDGFTELSILKEKLDYKEKDLAEREAELTSELSSYYLKKADLDSKEMEIYGAYEDIQEVCKVVEKMDAKNAASILSNIDSLDLVKNIIFQLSEEQAANILENLSPDVAAQITMDRFNNGIQ